MNRNTKEEVRKDVEEQASKQRATHFGRFAFAALMRDTATRKARLGIKTNNTTSDTWGHTVGAK